MHVTPRCCEYQPDISSRSLGKITPVAKEVQKEWSVEDL